MNKYRKKNPTFTSKEEENNKQIDLKILNTMR